MKKEKCSVENCTELRYSDFNNVPYCPKHLAQMKRHGKIYARTRFDPNEIFEHEDYAEIILYAKDGEINGSVIIDLEDMELCSKHKWYKRDCDGKEYSMTRIKGKATRMHRLILDFYDTSYDIDHIDGDGLNNQKSNLTIVTHQQNMFNQRKLPSNNTSGYIGVGWNKLNKCWDAQIKVNKKMIHLGSFKKIEDAIEARHQAELKYFGEYKRSNFEQ